MGYLSHSFFDPRPIITHIVNELIDYCFRPGLIIASSIINDIIDKFETESSLHSGPFALLEKHKINDGIRHLQKYPIEKAKILKSTFLKKFEYPIKVCNTQMNEKKMGNLPNY